jgi:hypothetical protein
MLITLMPDQHNQPTPPPLREGRPEERLFDRWFATLTKKEQAEYRKRGAGPYREMSLPRHSFPIYDNSAHWNGDDPRRAEPETESETWVSLERMQEVLSDALAMLGASDDQAVVNHFDLISIVLGLPDAPQQTELARRMKLTKQAISIRAKKMLLRASKVAPGILQRVKMQPKPGDRCADWARNIIEKNPNHRRVSKESLTPPPGSSWATHHGQKSQIVLPNAPGRLRAADPGARIQIKPQRKTIISGRYQL